MEIINTIHETEAANTVFVGNVRRRFYRNQSIARLVLSRIASQRRGNHTKVAPHMVSAGLWRVDDIVHDLAEAKAAAQHPRFF